jgi:hypothetical protein
LIYADGELQCKLLLIFYGKGGKKGRLIHKSLRVKYKLCNKPVVITFNDKAYAKADAMLE